jgi:hypothetical protein
MQRYVCQLGLLLGRLDYRYIRLVLLALALIPVALGAADPGAHGGAGG